MLKAPDVTQCGSSMVRCGLCGVSEKPFRILSKRLYSDNDDDDDDDDRRAFAEDLREEVTCFALLQNLILESINNLIVQPQIYVLKIKRVPSAVCARLFQLVLGRFDLISLTFISIKELFTWGKMRFELPT